MSQLTKTPEQASKQVADPNGVFIASGIVTLLGLIPGMPHFVFLPLGAAGIGLGFYIRQQAAEQQRAKLMLMLSPKLNQQVESWIGKILTKLKSSHWILATG